MSRTDGHNLIREYQRTRDPRLREQLVHRYLPLARSLARRFASGGEPLEDLEQVARPRARQGRRRLRRRARHGVLLLRGAEHRGRHQAPLPRSRVVGPRPARAAGASRCACTARERAERHARRGAHRGRAGRMPRCWAPRTCSRRASPTARCTPSSLDAPTQDADGDTPSLIETMGGDDDGYSTVLDRSALDSLLGGLDERDRAIVELYFREELTQSEIGERLGYVADAHLAPLRSAAGRQALRASSPTSVQGPASRPRIR